MVGNPHHMGNLTNQQKHHAYDLLCHDKPNLWQTKFKPLVAITNLKPLPMTSTKINNLYLQDKMLEFKEATKALDWRAK